MASRSIRLTPSSKRTLAAALWLSLALSSSAAHAAGAGTSGGQILSVPVGARAVAMGEAFTAMADDASSLYWNPAGIAILNQSQAAFMYNQDIQGMSFGHAAIGTPLETGGIGASVDYQSFGSIEGYDSSNKPTGNVSAYSAVATLGAGWYGDTWALGANAKALRSTLADVSATGIAGDLGLNLIYPVSVFGGTLRAATTVRNMGTGLKFLQERDPLPTELRLGLAAVRMVKGRLDLSMDYGKARDNTNSFYGGVEFRPLSLVALRAGYAGSHTESNGLRAGVGLRVKDFSFDYAFVNNAELGLSQRYELIYRFGVIQPVLTPEERRLLRQGKRALAQGNYDRAVLVFNGLIELAPHYRPARRLMNVAMKNGQQAPDTSVAYQPPLGRQRVADNDPALDDLESLLSDESVKKVQSGTSKSKDSSK